MEEFDAVGEPDGASGIGAARMTQGIGAVVLFAVETTDVAVVDKV